MLQISGGLVFPILLTERQRSLRCRPADRATGHLHATARAGSGELDGSFVVELANCVNAETGRAIDRRAQPPTPHRFSTKAKLIARPVG